MVAARFSGVWGSLAGKAPSLSVEPITPTTLKASTGKEHCLGRSPVIPPRQSGSADS